MAASPKRVANRHHIASTVQTGTDIASIYMNLSNGGGTFKVLDAGNGPEFIASIGSFGEMDAQIRVATSPEGLRRIGEMLLFAAGHPRYSQHWNESGGLALPDMEREMPTYWKKQLFQSFRDSITFWNQRDIKREMGCGEDAFEEEEG